MNAQNAVSPGKKPTVISTFSGCGGSSLGYHMAGFQELLAVEWDDNAVETFRMNFPGVPVYHGDIAQLTGEECMRLAGVVPGALDVFDGSPPCQGFSTAGKRKFDDPRNSLFREYARLLKELQPKVFVMENVTGIIKGHMKQAYMTIIAELRACGYQAKGEVLNAMHFNVPQSRERVIIIGVREDLGIKPSHPKPQTRPMTARRALDGVEVEPDQRSMLLEAGLKYVTYKEWPKMKPGTNRTALGFSSGFSCCKWHPDKPAQTVRKNDGHITMHGAMHWAEQRRFTVNEFKRFASFPDSFIFSGGWGNAIERIGNSVPPNMMFAIASHVKERLLGLDDRPT